MGTRGVSKMDQEGSLPARDLQAGSNCHDYIILVGGVPEISLGDPYH